jgi:hypothetical protein
MQGVGWWDRGVGVIVTSLTSTTTLDTRPTKARKAWWYEGGRTFSNMGSSICIWGHRANSGAHNSHVTSWVGEERGGGVRAEIRLQRPGEWYSMQGSIGRGTQGQDTPRSAQCSEQTV